MLIFSSLKMHYKKSKFLKMSPYRSENDLFEQIKSESTNVLQYLIRLKAKKS